MSTRDLRVCCGACEDYDSEGGCRYQFCECHDGIASMDGKPSDE